MKNPSNRVSELKKGDFKPLEIFFLKIHGFSVKKWKWIKNGQKIPKKFEIRSRHDFLLFLSYELIKSKILGFWAILRHFSSFLVGTLKGPIRRCTCRWIWIFWSKLCSMGSKLYLRFNGKKILLVKSPQKIELKNLRFLTDEIWSFLHHKSANDHS